MHVSIASDATAWPSLRFAFQRSTALYLLASLSIVAPGTHPPALDPKCESRSSALIALCVLIPCRAADAQNRAAALDSAASYPRWRNAPETKALWTSTGMMKFVAISQKALA